MARLLKTDWKRIGRSGPTVDGREIPPEAIEQAAQDYDKKLFTALIWPEHFRFLNLGQVEELRFENNIEGGKDLFARLAPNEFYQQANNADQKLFTSMELMDNFRGTGRTYLSGLGATDDPASAATSEIRFSAIPQNGQLIAQPIEATTHTFKSDSKPTLMQRLMGQTQPSEDDDMADKAALEKLQQQFAALQTDISILKAGGADAGDDKPQGDEEPAEAIKQFAKIVERLDAIEKQFKSHNSEPDQSEKLTALESKLEKLSADLSNALKEAGGTEAGEHSGDGEDLKEYI